jgi:hypothetical protein
MLTPQRTHGARGGRWWSPAPSLRSWCCASVWSSMSRVEHRLKQDQDLRHIGERQLLDPVSETPELSDRSSAPGAYSGERRFGESATGSIGGLVADECRGARVSGARVTDTDERAVESALRCRGAVVKCAAKSTCGKPNFVTCCRTNAKGVTKCSTKSSANSCEPQKGGSACVGTFSSCCDACTATGCASSPSGAFLDR